MSTTTGSDPAPRGPDGVSREPDGASMAMSAALARNWWLLALRGVLGILFGLIAFAFPGATILTFVLFFSAYMLVDGVFAILAAVRAARQHERWGLLVLEGLANIAAGVVAFIWPGLTILVFVLLIAVWALISGGFMLAAAFRLDREHGRWWLAFGGVVSILYGIALVIAPMIGAIVLTWWIGAYALVFGVALLVLAFKLRSRHAERTAAVTRNV
jgi:uncharacterized membrane protein HdeD (DUF308 family)